jgi:flavin reductase (DIM6/NTAB) family NADH-FMN oxidoreductase RutF
VKNGSWAALIDGETTMDANAKKSALRMIPYGLYVLTAESQDGRVAAATVNCVTQASFQPPLVAVAVKADSATHEIVKGPGPFALNVLTKEQNGVAFTFFKSLERDGDTIGAEAFRRGKTGSPILANVSAFVECSVVGALEKGDHTLLLGEVVEAGASLPSEARSDEQILHMKDLGEKTFYGG